MCFFTVCLTVCLFISPDLDGFISPVCFTACLFISPDLDGYRASLTPRDPENCKVPKPGMFHGMFVYVCFHGMFVY